MLGLLPTAVYDASTLRREAGDLVIACSDGVSEARSAAGEEFGPDRVLDVARGGHGQPPQAVLAHLMGALSRWAHGAAQGDDITAMVVRYRGR